MKNVRLYFTKTDRLRFISHLDMNRFMNRAVRRAKLPIWYTEGFNPHPHIIFALPLSLGFESTYDVVDLRLTDDDIEIDTLCDRLNAVCPEGIHFFDAKEPVAKIAAVTYADFEITFADEGALEGDINALLEKESIICEKKTKKGGIKEIDIKQKLVSASVNTADGNTVLSLRLPAGSADNVNPELFTNYLFENGAEYYCYRVVRTSLLDEKQNLFK